MTPDDQSMHAFYDSVPSADDGGGQGGPQPLLGAKHPCGRLSDHSFAKGDQWVS
jgi:hypothetical protein